MCLDPTFKNYTFMDGKYSINWRSDGRIRVPGDKAVMIKCNNCPECWNEHSNEWADRCYLESLEHKENCVLTLTYKDTNGELSKRDYQLFLKKLRKAIYPTKIKYFISGEYGSLHGRPHFHLIIFGWRPDDCTFYSKSKSGCDMYNSKFVESFWKHGWVTIDLAVDRKACFYSAKYLQKAINRFGVKHKQPAFSACSKGIAIAAANKFDPELDNHIYINGKPKRVPRYFRKIFAKSHPFRAWVDTVEREEKVSKIVNLLNLPVFEKYRFYVKKSIEKRAENLIKWQKFFDKYHIPLVKYNC